MTDYLQFFGSVFQMSWGEGGYKYLFYLSLLLILVLDKRSNVKLVLAMFPIAFHVLVFNPLFYKLFFSRLFTMNNIPYYNRFFSFLPIMICIAAALVEVLKGFRGGLRLAATLGSIALVVAVGTNVYDQDWMRPAENLSKTPEFILELCDALKTGENICVATPANITEYIRQTDATFVTPYGREINQLGVALSNEDDVDVGYIMNEAGAEDVDYVVAWNTGNVRARFSESGYEPFYENERCLAYRVTGVERHHRFLNDRRQVIGRIDYDRDGRVIKDERGFSIIGFEYDDQERRIREAYYDENWQPFTVPGGYASVRREFNRDDKICRERFFDAGDHLIMVQGQAELRNEYDARGRMIRQTCYDTQGNPCVNDYGSHEVNWTYDQKGNLTQELYKDTAGRLCNRNNGIARIERQYDEFDRLTSLTFWDEAGIAAVNADYGYHGFCYEYSEKEGNKLVYETSLDRDEQPMIGYDGYATLRRTYDERGNVVEERTYDTAGALVCRNEGYAIVQRQFDYNGHLIKATYYDDRKQKVDYEP